MRQPSLLDFSFTTHDPVPEPPFPVVPSQPEPELLKLPPANPNPVSLAFPKLNVIQEESLKALMALKLKHGAIIAPVGSGKTILAMKAWDLLGQPKMLIAVPRIIMIQNPWLDELTKLGIDEKQVGLYYGETKEVKSPITIALYQTLLRHPDVMKRFDMVVFDEADVLSGQVYARLLPKVAELPYVIGLTGTIIDAYRRSPTLQRHLPRIIERTISDGRRQNLLAPANLVQIPVELTAEERTDYDKLTAAFRNLLMQAHHAKTPRDEFLLKRQAFIVNQARLGLLSNAEAKAPEVLRIIQEDPKRPTLVFSSSVVNAEKLNRELRRLGVPSETITATTKKEDRERIMKTFGTDFHVLFSVGVLARGYNVPEVSREVIVGTSSNQLTQVEQRLGRALRRDPKNPDKVAAIYVLTASHTVDLDMMLNARRALTRL
jgi:superfamily II DNA or RNA helicase